MNYSRPLRIEEPKGAAFELAVEQFEKGEFFVFRGAGFGLRPPGLEIRATTERSPEDVDKEEAELVIAKAKEKLSLLQASSSKFKHAVSGLVIRIVVLYDYGMGGIEVAEWNNGKFQWHKGYPKAGKTV